MPDYQPLHLFHDTRSLRLGYASDPTKYLDFIVDAAGDLTVTKSGSANGAISFPGIVFIGDDANTKMTLGLTINQGVADDEILAGKSPDVVHGITTVAETDTFFAAKKNGATNGGLRLTSIGVNNAESMLLEGIANSGDTAKTTAARAPLIMDARKANGTGTQAMGANENIAVIANRGIGRFVFDAEAELHCIGTSTSVYGPSATVGGGFGCNAQAAQTAFASGGALAAYGAGANGLDSGANMSALHASVVAMRAALVANGIMS